MVDSTVILHDALVVSGWLVTLGGVIAMSGRAAHSQRRALGGMVSLLGLMVAAVAAGAWHHSAWGEVTALVLLVICGGSLAAASLPARRLRPSDTKDHSSATPSEVRP